MDYMDHDLTTLAPSTVAFIPHASLRRLMLGHPRITAALGRETLIDAASSANGWSAWVSARASPASRICSAR